MPEHLMNAVRLTDKLREVRATVDRIYGARAMEQLKPYMDLLWSVHEEKGIPILTLGRQMAEELELQGISPLMLLGAMVELIEPSDHPLITAMENAGIPVSDRTRDAARELNKTEEAMRQSLRPEPQGWKR